MGKDILNKKEKKSILFFTHYLNGGGAEKTIRRLVAYINSHEPEMQARECVIFDDEAYHDEVPDPIVLSSRSKPGDLKILRAVNVIKQILELKKVKKDAGADVCISFLPGSDIINVLSPIGEKRIISVRNKESFFVHNLFRKQYIRYTYEHCDKIVCVSDVVRRDVTDFFGAPADRTVTIYNAIEDKKDKKNAAVSPVSPRDKAFMEGNRVIVTAGRLNFQKGQDHLIRAFAHMVGKGGYDDCRLMILGSGELMEALKELTRRLGIEDKVRFTGNIHGPEEYFKASDVFVLSSYIEGIPNVLLEAMQCGLPCISTECGAREILSPDTDCFETTDRIDTAEYGVLVPACDKRDDITETDITKDEIILSDAISLMLDDNIMREDYISKCDRCISEYAPDLIFGKWIKIIKETMM